MALSLVIYKTKPLHSPGIFTTFFHVHLQNPDLGHRCWRYHKKTNCERRITTASCSPNQQGHCLGWQQRPLRYLSTGLHGITSQKMVSSIFTILLRTRDLHGAVWQTGHVPLSLSILGSWRWWPVLNYRASERRTLLIQQHRPLYKTSRKGWIISY
jgi:hypothetical protein